MRRVLGVGLSGLFGGFFERGSCVYWNGPCKLFSAGTKTLYKSKSEW